MTTLLALVSVVSFRLMVCVHSEFIEPSPSLALRSFSGTQTRLPCRFTVEGEETLVQVTWYREKPGGEREQIIIGHFTEGPKASPDFLNRVQFESSEPTVDSTLLILNTKKADQATYTCHVSIFPSGNFERQISLTVWKHASEFAHALGSPSETLLIIVGASVAGVLVIVIVMTIVFVNCHLRRKNRKLKRALSVRTEEMISLSRQVSMRRLNSINGDPRTALEEGSLIQMDSVMKGSVLSVEDHSALSDVRGRRGVGEYDSLGRPAIYTPYRPERSSKIMRESEEERKERRRRVESFVKSSNMSLDSGLHRDQSSPPPSMSSGLTGDAIGEGWKRGSRREIHRDVQRERVPEGEEESSAVNSYQLSEAVSNYFQCSNGGLTPKANTNGIIIHSQRSVM
uniref:Nectin cell adhesion molecule 4b n=1 Tax=Cyprinus carpio carpio TaxID=630221 RepID=A0A9J8ACF3_CYPCA